MYNPHEGPFNSHDKELDEDLEIKNEDELKKAKYLAGVTNELGSFKNRIESDDIEIIKDTAKKLLDLVETKDSKIKFLENTANHQKIKIDSLEKDLEALKNMREKL
jgi:16S rRNA G527 N7-methylase RsmG